MDKPVSIFNEVIGPIMRGPSSSHTAGAYRIGLYAKNIFRKDLIAVKVEFSTHGSLPTTYVSHGSEMGLLGGLLGIDLASKDIIDILDIAKQRGLDVQVVPNDLPCEHPNIYNLTLFSKDGDSMKIEGISTGGGAIKITKIDDLKTDIDGDEIVNIEYREIGDIQPILPIKFTKNSSVPFASALEFQKIVSKDFQPWEYALDYESKRGEMSKQEVWEVARKVTQTMRESIVTGLKGTEYEDRILGQQFHLIDEGIDKNLLINSSLINRIEKYALAIMECKSSLGVIVAAPTAGSCAVLPSAIFACCDEFSLSEDDAIKAVLASGLIGVFIAKDSTFSAEEAGCQAECGAASGMVASGLVQLMNGNAVTAIQASSFALQNILGMICDPIATRVEAPCLGKNIMCALNAVTSANMALAGVDTLIPLNEVISVMDKVGRAIPREFRCTGLGGLSVCKTSLDIEKKLVSLGRKKVQIK